MALLIARHHVHKISGRSTRTMRHSWSRARFVSASPTISVVCFFGLKLLIGVALITVSARQLSVSGFSVFSQLFLFLALITTIAAGGAQSGLARQVAIAADRATEVTAVRAGLRLWAGWGVFLIVSVLIGQHAISVVLTGNTISAEPVIWLTLLAVTSGVGQLHCARLTGRGEVVQAMLLQGAGLLIGGGLCVERLASGHEQQAVLGYAAGSLVAVVGFFIDIIRGSLRGGGAETEVRRETATLLRFSASFLLVASALPSTLFVVRYLYRAEFGSEALGYWLMANRVSDVSTQLMGLYLGQVFLPAIARVKPGLHSTQLMLRTIALGMGVTLAGLAAFTMLKGPVISVFLSDSYRPATPYIIGYLIGDTFRVTGNVALYTALGRGNLRIYVALEFAYAAVVGATISLFVLFGWKNAPYIGYPLAHLICCAVISMSLWRLGRLKPRHVREFPVVSGRVADEL
jgi:O-antigen/teichoic acid export membrane protein